MRTPTDTIAAISTPPGEGAIGIVRMSGGESVKIADLVFRGKVSPAHMNSHMLNRGEIRDNNTGRVLDSVLLTVMRAPNSYTGEDMVEIHCHGGPVVLAEVLELLYRSGASPASRGEFSKRAFLNGRMDLCEAEAVLDLIRAKTREAAQSAVLGLIGAGKGVLEELKESTVKILAQVEACIDFPEDDTLLDEMGVARETRKARDTVARLIESGMRGKLMREGVTAAIVGKPNVGKSSLLNGLLEEERAIVTPVPGTTRDYLAEWIDLGGIPVRLIDTAGLRESQCDIEMLGVVATRKAIETADFVLLLLDWSSQMTEEDSEVFRAVGEKEKIVLANKCDLEQRIDASSLGEWFPISAKYGHGLEELRDKMKELVWRGGAPDTSAVFTRARHLAALKEFNSHLDLTLRGLEEGKTPEILAVELRDALSALAEIAGETTTEDVLDAIFSEFCIGK